MTSHYIPRYTRRMEVLLEAACKAWVHRFEHSCEPTCPVCVAYLMSEPNPEGTPR